MGRKASRATYISHGSATLGLNQPRHSLYLTYLLTDELLLCQELFSKCTGVICSSGNETIWEAVSRGVPVLTIPSPGAPLVITPSHAYIGVAVLTLSSPPLLVLAPTMTPTAL